MSDQGEFLERHPWPDEWTALGEPLEFLWSFDLDVSAQQLWPWIADTSRMNRAMGVTRMEFSEKDGRLHGTTRNAGVRQDWVEVPWDWIAERSLTSVRLYSRGFAHVVRAVYEIAPRDGGVQLRVYFGWIPRGGWQRALLKVGMKRLGAQYARVLEDIVRHCKEQATATPYDSVAPELAPESHAQLDGLAAQVEHVSPDLLQRILDWVRTGDDMDVHRIQVLPLARRWRTSEDETIVAFLQATRAGLLTMSWDVICPHCRGVREEVRTLGEIPRKAECEVCQAEFGTDSDNAIEVTFHIHPSIRHVPKLFFCSAEPSKKAHIKLQQRLAPGAALEVSTVLPPGRYRARVQGQNGHTLLDVVESADTSRCELSASERPEQLRVGVSPRLRLSNPTDSEQTFVLEDARWSDDALRPARLFSLQEFRDLFSEAYLDADVQLSVGRQTILFTDVVGSTRLYAVRGDPGAFVDVKRHFTEIYQEVKDNGGAIVKTIGDAAMAAFVDPVRALRAANAIHARFPEGREDLRLRLRISLNTGPCIAVKLNTDIDYFGNTVNVAAKLQAIADAGQVSFTEELLEQPGVRDYLTEQGAELEHLVLDSPSLAAPVAAVRWTTVG